MGRRVLTALLALLALFAVLWQRSRRRAAALLDGSEPVTAPLSAPPAALPAPPAEISAPAEDRDPSPNARPEGEKAHNGARSIHNEPRFPSIPWEPADGDPGPAATSFEIRLALLEDHMELARVDVRETASQVFVTVLARFDPSARGETPTAETQRTATVVLKRPLGDRTLVHAPTDDPPR